MDKDFRRWMRELGEASKARERERKKSERWGVFVWRGDNLYRETDAVRIYKNKAAAEKFADANYVLNYVARPL